MVGRTITGKFKIIQQIDTGGMGSVFKADHLDLSRTVAIKKINQELTGEPEALERFKLEAKALAQLTHGNVATIYDFVIDEGEPFLVMEFVEGVDLYRMIEQGGALPLNVAAPLFCGVLRGFSAIHGKQIVHRDIKPKNVIVTWSGEPKIIDFGIARMAGRSGVTQYGQTLGTPAYMSPEQVLGEKLDIRSDLYSLAVVLFEMLTGAPPFQEDGPIPVQKAHLTVAPPFLSSKVKGLPGKLDAVLAKGLSKKPEKRYQTADEFRRALESVLGVALCAATAPVQACLERIEQGHARPSSGAVPGPTQYAGDVAGETRFAADVEPTGRKGKSIPWRWIAVGTAIVCLLAAIGVGVAVFARRTQPKPPAPAPQVQSAPAAQPPVTSPPETPPPVQPVTTAPGAAAPETDAAKVEAGGQADRTQVKRAPAARPAKSLSKAEKLRLDALKALGEIKEEKKQ